MSGETVPYATPGPSRPSHWPAAILCGTGLGLVLFGGCFLIGVMLVATPGALAPTSRGLTPAQILLMVALYATAFSCFAGAVGLITMGVRRLR